jgi:hypothetical protein
VREGTGQGSVEPFTFSFHSRGPGTYKGLMMLRCDDPTAVFSDVRVYAVEITAIPETIGMDLESRRLLASLSLKIFLS